MKSVEKAYKYRIYPNKKQLDAVVLCIIII
ncbi:MAG: helix-turn-helix domain-containing protein [Lachnospiraceae bacterium]|nr:helix-turn-helix domain-containing protein [Lachnospiraceae bacterium]